MRRAASLTLILLLAACSKQEPPPVVSAAPAKPAPAAATPTAPAVPLPDGLPSDVSAKASATAEALAKEGAALFAQTCATCHMADGGGVPYMQPSIKGSAWISNPDPQLLLSLILRGATVLGGAADAYDNKMPPLDHLSDAEIAAVATYVRQRFAAVPITEPVTLAQVALARSRPGLP